MIMINRFSEKNVTDRVMFSQACVKNSVPGGRGLCPSMHHRSHDWGVSVRETPRTETPRTVTSGRYASHWNTFLLQLILIEIS